MKMPRLVGPYPMSHREMQSMVAWPDMRATLAAQDRDLKAEAENTDGQATVLATTLSFLYPFMRAEDRKEYITMSN